MTPRPLALWVPQRRSGRAGSAQLATEESPAGISGWLYTWGVLSPQWSFSDSDVRALGEGEALVRDDMFEAAKVMACATDLDDLHVLKRLSPGGMGRDRARAQAHRNDETIWAADVETSRFIGISSLFDEVQTQLNHDAWLGLGSFEVQLALYSGDGARYVQHQDAFRGDRNRRVTAIIYLNPDWAPADGGRLRIHPPSGSQDLDPVGGRLIVFLSDRLEHEVLPCHARRRAATAWYRD